MTYIINKREYNQAFVHFLKNKFKVTDETDAVVALELSENEARKVARQVFKRADEITEYSDFLTKDKEAEKVFKVFDDATRMVQEAMEAFTSCPAVLGDENMSRLNRERYLRIYDEYNRMKSVGVV